MSNDINFHDLQGLIRFGHGQLSQARFLLLCVRDAKAAATWLQAAPVTTAEADKNLPQQALQIAFTSAGLRALKLDEGIINEFSEEFIAGMSGDDNRSRRLGDIGSNHPDHWEWGGKEQEVPHILLMLYSHSDGMDAWQRQLQTSQFDAAFTQIKELQTNQNDALEPFGFADGISQPQIDWQRNISADVHERDAYTNLLALGEVVLGYPNEYGLYTARPLLDPKQDLAAATLPVAEDFPTMRDLGCNGSYLVLRQLSQDVPGFWQFIDRAASSDASQRDRLAAAMIGRQRDGTPLVSDLHKNTSNTEVNNKQPENNFTFDQDPHGCICPVGAHIRRANPRTGDLPSGVGGMFSRLIKILGFGRRYPLEDLVASTRFHRILRRGRAYGSVLAPEDAVKPDAPVDERGLQFVCLGANISRQFDFVQNAWMMSTKFSGLSNESDPLLGNRAPLLNGDPTDRFTYPQQSGPDHVVSALPQFVSVRGGAYFFMPGINALQYIASTALKGTS